jgi:hypothetical protein
MYLESIIKEVPAASKIFVIKSENMLLSFLGSCSTNLNRYRGLTGEKGVEEYTAIGIPPS